jgi:hypothetical protein
LNFKISEQASPGGRIRFGDRSQLRPRQVRVDQGDVRNRRAGIFGIAAVDRAAQPAHQRGHFRAEGKLAARAGFDDADALDTAHVGNLRPLPLAHVQFGVVETERLDFDHHVACFRIRLGHFANFQHFRATEFLSENRSHWKYLLICRSRFSLPNGRRGRIQKQTD